MTEDLSIIAIGIAMVSVAIAGGGFALSLKKSKMEKLTHQSQFISNIHNELLQTEQKVDRIKTKVDHIDYAIDYLNIFSKLCYFDERKYLSKDIMEFFINYLEVGLAYYHWLLDIEFLKEEDKEQHFLEVVNSCTKYNVQERTPLHAGNFEAYRKKFKKN